MNESEAKQMMKGITDISFLGLFGHLFEVHPQIVGKLKKLETECRTLNHYNLERALGVTTPDIPRNSELVQSQIRQSLSQIFNPGSKFWTTYYSRLQNSGTSEELSADLELTEFRKRVNVLIGSYYIGFDALFYSSRGNAIDYEVLLKSIQAYLCGSLLAAMGNSTAARLELQRALSIVGPIDTVNYRHCIASALNKLNSTSPEIH